MMRVFHAVRALGCVVMTVLPCLFSPCQSGTAHAYCTGDGDSCPGAAASLEVFQVCGNVSTSTCVGTYPVTWSDDISFGQIVVSGNKRLAACVNGSIRRLRHSGYRGGGMVNWGIQEMDMAYCSGAGDDVLRVGTTNGSCGGTSIGPWDYGWGSYWFELRAQSGQDHVAGGTGHDRICGGTGDDRGFAGNPPGSRGLCGYSLSDDIDGWTGDDFCEGYTGDGDTVWGYDGRDYVLDATGAGEYLFGENGADYCVYDGQSGASAIHCATAAGYDDSTADVTGNALWQTSYCEVHASCYIY